MGVYDTVVFFCPNCGDANDVQIKTGYDSMSRYTISELQQWHKEAIDRGHFVVECKCGRTNGLITITEVAVESVG